MIPTEVHKAQELIYELKVGEIMSCALVTVTPATRMETVKQLLRDRRISGLPVVEGGRLVGIVSIEDLILAMEKGRLDAPVGEFMTAQVHTAGVDESVVQALGRFAQTRVGRLPVLDAAGELAGIITPDDITRGVLRALQQAFHEEESRLTGAAALFDDLQSDRTILSLQYTVAAGDFRVAGSASSKLKAALHRLGVNPRILRRLAIISYEAEMNIVIHSTDGGHLLAEISGDAVTIVAEDAGPGIEDVQRALQPGFSTASDLVREMGFGAGMGLANISNCADEMTLDSAPGSSTRLTARVILRS